MDIKIISDKLEKFFNEVATVQHYQRLSDDAAKRFISELHAREQNLKELDADSQEAFGTSLHAFSFYNPYTGIIQPYSHNMLTNQEKAKLVYLLKNKQYQWLLVEAYELFEDFIVWLYHHVRGEHPELRLSKDSSATEMSFIELKKKIPQVIDNFRRKLPEFKNIEIENKTDINLRLHLCMIEKFRHIIVHKNGITGDSDSIINEILKRANVAGDKAREPSARKTIANYMGINDYKGWIVLVEQSVFNYGGISMNINRHENLVNSLLACALVLSRSLLNYLTPSQTN
ncbi:hypothetical protein [Paraburkholderia hospita]|uniref:hypothetical protein n=1 Tax=Paraburkholderia hospita TaxID=169430 RepID=UPI003ECD247D